MLTYPILLMKKTALVLMATLFVGCTTLIKLGHKVERAATPADAVNFFTTQPDGSIKSEINDSRISRKIEVTAARKSKTANGFTQVQFDLRNVSYISQTVKIACEFLNADGAVVEKQEGWTNLPFQPGAMQTYTAMALETSAVECRLRLIDR
jgi:hypothetical protein